MSIAGNTIAQIQISTTTKNDVGESVKEWTTVQSIAGWLDLSSGNSETTTFNAKLQESTHVFVADYVALDTRIKPENSRMLVDNERYDVLLVDDPMRLHKQLEIYLKYTGGQ